MKKIEKFLVFALFSLLIFSVSCQNNPSITSPEKTSSLNEDPNWIELPVIEDQQFMKVHKASGLITVKNGGKISLKKKFKGGPHNSFEINAEIKIGPKLVDKDTEFTLALDDKTGMLTFSPAVSFNGNLLLSVSLKGIDLDGVDEEDIGFVYCDDDGKYVEVDYKKLVIDVENGELAVLRIPIENGTRYGFTK